MSVVLLGMAAALAAYLAVGLAWSIRRSLRRGRERRRELALRLRRVRLHGVLRQLGVDVRHYLYRRRCVDIERDLQACTACTATDRCDQVLGGRAVPLDFCPSYPVLQKLCVDSARDE